jgi:multiple sugar transport system permease protein
MSLRLRENLSGYLLVTPWFVGLLVFYLGSMAYSLYLSLYESNMMAVHEYVGLKNYETLLFKDRTWSKALVNTIYYTFLSVPLGTVASFGIAMLLNSPRVRGLGFWRTIYYLPSIVTGVAVSLLWLWIYHPEIGLLNVGLAAIGIEGPAWLVNETTAMPSLILMSLWGVGSPMLIYLAGLQGVPSHLYEAAKIDGANAWRCFWHVTVPMMTPTLFFTFVIGIIGSFQVFTQSLILTDGGPNNATMTQVLHIYNRAYLQFQFGYGSALAWVLFFIILAFTLVAIRLTSHRVHYEGEAR